MLIDSSHPEETRVAIVDTNSRLIDYDFETSTKQTLKGNVYLGKVMRVEPSLQAAFVDYGGNRHGFLAFNEIHPDYFRIPMSDRDDSEEIPETEESIKTDIPAIAEASIDVPFDDTPTHSDEEFTEPQNQEGESFDMEVSTIAGESFVPVDEPEETTKIVPLHQMYKIQEVIQKNQIILVQVVKEERGGKGAALTSYLSMAGRYCVLMPNSPRGGGISRKIYNSNDRKRLRQILDTLSIPEGMSLIIRTAGKERTRAEVKRDAEYLMRLWNTIREQTLVSIAPSLIYQEDEIIKRAIRDLYTRDIEEVTVEGAEGYKIAKSFMKTLMPSHAKRVQKYKEDTIPMFLRHRIEAQIDAMHDPQVHLPSGGSLVIHPTEALVSIDINSGKATRERNIEDTALKTNLEAAEEISRQVRLRDLAGLIVIDFIDMDDHKHVLAVERKIREAFRDDRARVQMGKISPFGLLELSRQRLRPSIVETSALPCPHCNATGFIRSTESVTLQILRNIEEVGFENKAAELEITAPIDTAFYLLNKKRKHLRDLEVKYDLIINILGAEGLQGSTYSIQTTQDKETASNNTKDKTKESKGKIDTPETSDDKKNQKGQKKSPKKRNSSNQRKKQKAQQNKETETPQVIENQDNVKPLISDVQTDAIGDIPQENKDVDGNTIEEKTSQDGTKKRTRRTRYRNSRRNNSRRKKEENSSDSSDHSDSTKQNSVESIGAKEKSPKKDTTKEKNEHPKQAREPDVSQDDEKKSNLKGGGSDF